MKNLALFILVASLVSCTGSFTLHDYGTHGAHQLTTGNFDYVAHGVTGSSSAIYNKYGGGKVKTGLLAEAKKNLWMKHPLEANQAYVNMSFDHSVTKAGVFWNGTFLVRYVETKVVVSADIIEYERTELLSAQMSGAVSIPKSMSSPTPTDSKFVGFRQVTDDLLTKGMTVFVDTGDDALQQGQVVSTRTRGNRTYVSVEIGQSTAIVSKTKIYLN